MIVCFSGHYESRNSIADIDAGVIILQLEGCGDFVTGNFSSKLNSDGCNHFVRAGILLSESSNFDFFSNNIAYGVFRNDEVKIAR